MIQSSKPLVVLVAHGVHDRGGMERACYELIRHASGRFDFCVVSAELAPEVRSLVHGWCRVRVPSRPIPLKSLVFWVRAGLILRQLDADLIHAIGAVVPNCVDLASIHFCHAGYIAKTKNQLAPAGVSSLRRANTVVSRSLALIAERWAFRPSRLRAFAAVSQGLAQEAARHYPAIPCTVTPNGVDLVRFRPDPSVRAEVRSAEGTPTSRTVTLFVGGDWARKGLNVAIAAVAGARAFGEDVELWVVGRGDTNRFALVGASLGIKSYVRFFGVRNDTERFYQAADIFILPSSYEGFSLACLEAAACGLPLLIPAISGAWEIVGESIGGYVTESSVPSFTAALIQLASDPALRLRLGSEARRRAEPYEWERSAEAVTDLYVNLLSRSGI